MGDSHGVNNTGETRSAGGHIAIAGALCAGRYPEGIQASVRQIEFEFDFFAGERSQISTGPRDLLERFVYVQRSAVCLRESRQDISVFIERFDQ